MKNLWLWLVGIAVAAFALFKWRGSQATAQNAAVNVPINPVTTLWNQVNQDSASWAGGAVTSAQKAASSLANQLGSVLGVGLSRGGQSPQTSGSGSGAPTPSQMASASANPALFDDTTDYGSSGGGDYGG